MTLYILCVASLGLLSWRAAALLRAPEGRDLLPRTLSSEVGEEPGNILVQQPVDASRMRRETLNNYYDVSYTGRVLIGGESIETIFDTGSFELVVLSQDCKECGDKLGRLYDSKRSQTYKDGNVTGSCTYGSGTAYTEASYDDVSIEALQGSEQFFWKVYQADESLSGLFKENSFGAILGCGPSASVESFAVSELQSIHKEVNEYTMSGGVVSGRIAEIVREYEEKVEMAKRTTTILDKLDVRDMSVCFGKESGSYGYFIWNDVAPKADPQLFIEVPVVGDFYWSAELTDARVGGFAPDLIGELSLPASMASPLDLGCIHGRCSAVMDTGTTLINAPSAVAFAIDDMLYQWEDRGGDCKDLSMLPDLEFKLGGKSFALPPEAYVAQYTGTSDSLEKIKNALPGLYTRHVRRLNRTETETYNYCASLISPMNAESQFGPLWIMGMSFFRAYYSSFHMEPGVRTLKGTKMSFSIPDGECRPTRHPDTPQQLFEGKHLKRRAQLRVDVSKIRTSALADRVRGMKSPKIHQLNSVRREMFQDKDYGDVIVRI